MNIDDFEKLKLLHEKGVLTDEEFDEQRKFLIRDVIERNGDDVITRSSSSFGKTAKNVLKEDVWHWYKYVWSRWGDFDGRAGRTEYWCFFLCNVLIGFVAGVIDGFLGMKNGFSGVYSVIVFFPWLAVCVRRLHDTGTSGRILLVPIPLSGMLLAVCLPVLIRGGEPPETLLAFFMAVILSFFCFCCYLFYLMVKKSDKGENKYGVLPY